MPQLPVKLLLIEDSVHDVELTLLALETSDMVIKPVVVYDHRGAREALELQSFDIIICDYLLPSSSGLQVLEVAKQLSARTPFIFLSGMMAGPQTAETMRLGAVDYILKQDLKMLAKAVKRALAEVQERIKRVDAENALEELEARARLAIEAAEMGVWELNVDTLEIIWDERCKALYEVPPNIQLDLECALSLTHPQDLDMLKAYVERALREESSLTAEYRISLPGDRTRWFLSNGRSVFREGRCVRFSGVIQDITDRKVAAQDLVQENATLGKRVEERTRERDRTWEVSKELLAVLRFDMTPVAFNPAWEVALGWTRQEMERIRLWELMHPDDLDLAIRETRSVANGNISTKFVNRMRHANGQYRWLSWTIVPENGLMYAAVRDTTEERAVVDELAATNQRLLEQIEEREKIEATLQQMQRLEVIGQLTAGVAHDFNNLLTIILASTSLAEKAYERGIDGKIPQRLRNIKEAGERGAKLTAQLLSFSRRQRLEPVPIDLNETVAEMQNLLIKAIGPGVWLETSLADDLWKAAADPTQTEMIILNLAINARDAMGSGGTLTLATYNEFVDEPAERPEHPEPGSYVVISLRDTGCGMPPEVLKKAFEPFFTTKAVGKGSGLGLAQVFGFAKQSGGGVRIDSALNEGTTVDVYLPRTTTARLQVDRSEILDSVASKPAHILLVDDDHAVREVTAIMLESLGHTVIQAHSGLNAMHILDDKIDLIITDYAMPGMTGTEMAGMISSIFPQLPIIFITGYADAATRGLDNAIVVQKPFRESDLLEKIFVAMAK